MSPFKPFNGFRSAARAELNLFKGRPMLALACAGVVALPSLYAVTYLSSIWDPYGQLDQLPVAIVNEDHGTQVQGKHVQLGRETINTLLEKKPFTFETYPTREEAEKAVNQGKAYFALFIPPDFSEDALGSEGPTSGTLTIYTSPGTSYLASTLGKRFGNEVAQSLNDTLSRKRLDAVASGVKQLHEGSQKLTAGVQTLQNGSQALTVALTKASEGGRKLDDGAAQVAEGVEALTRGMSQAGGAIRLMAEKTPSQANLNRLAEGSSQLASGSAQLYQGLTQLSEGQSTLSTKTLELSRGLGALETGSGKLSEGSEKLISGLKQVPLVGGKISQEAKPLSDGAAQLYQGLQKAHSGSQQLAQGAQLLSEKMSEAARGSQSLSEGALQLNEGVQALTNGMSQLGNGLQTLAEKLPEDAQLTQLSDGSWALASGMRELSGGLDALSDGGRKLDSGIQQVNDGMRALDAGLAKLEAALPASEGGISPAVVVQEESVSHVGSNGISFAPYFMALSLYVGALMTSFIFSFFRVPESTVGATQGARILSKSLLPASIVIGQAIVLGLTMRYGMLVPIPRPMVFHLILIAASLTFLTVVQALVFTLKDTGKGLAVLLLLVQLGAAGGPFPIELSNGFFQAVHGFLPITFTVKALRATLFGAYLGDWGIFLGCLAICAAIALSISYALGRRWKPVPDEAYAPVIDL